MRCHVLIPLVLLTSACWSPGPSEVNPIHYPWHSVTRKAPDPTILPIPRAKQNSEYCVIMIEQPGTTGIRVGGNSPVAIGCAPPQPAPAAQPTEPEESGQEIWIMCAPPPEERKNAAKRHKPSCGE